MSYTSKYIGNEIDELLDKVASGSANVSRITLWEGDLNKINTHIALSQSLEEFDYISIDVNYTIQNMIRYMPITLLDTKIIKNTYGANKRFLGANAALPDGYSSTQTLHLLFGFENSTDFFVYSAAVETISAWSITKIEGIKLNNLVAQSSDSAPTGNIISFMGTKAPNGYLVCDGAELEISKYTKLAAHFEEQFGTKNHFGGNGTTTFAVPDLRNEFLRGYHGDAEKTLSGEIGIHQDATMIPHFYLDNTNDNFALLNKSGTKGNTGILNSDDGVDGIGQLRFTTFSGKDNSVGTELDSHKTTRPTNVAVLYCIKY